MKVIDLLNKIANREEAPNKIKWGDIIFEKEEYQYSFTYKDENGDFFFSDEYGWEEHLNDEVEIIEYKPKKIEKLTPFEAPYLKDDGTSDVRFQIIINQLNNIIDHINKGEYDE